MLASPTVGDALEGKSEPIEGDGQRRTANGNIINIIKDYIFGKYIVFTFVIEFQKKRFTTHAFVVIFKLCK